MSSRIQVTPEQLEKVSSQFGQAYQQSNQMVLRLQQSIQQIESQWEGMTRERFYAEYVEAKSRMSAFVASLHNVQMELQQIADKFRSTDASADNSAATMQASMLAGGSAAAGGTVLAASKAKDDSQNIKVQLNPEGSVRGFTGKNLQEKLMNGVEASGTLDHNANKYLYGDVLTGSASASGKSGLSAEGSIVKSGFTSSYAEGSVSLANASVEASVKDGNVSVGAEATLVKYDGGISIPLPWTDKELKIGGSASLGTVGASAEIGKDGLKFHLPLGPGASLVGVGGSISVE
ncbi:WXG100 family type VII secretion target [Paenibacillus terreus]|uniref:WXG100 family type VII secretion target n=1 Tax=Paenibacillus terreus TaxID=1387834 RepID=A0ABV5BBY7_9BACL